MNSNDQIKADYDARLKADLDRDPIERPSVTLTIKEMQEVCEALAACDEYLEDREDVVDGPDGSPRPNRAMQLRMVVHEAMSALDAAMNRVDPP